MNVSQQISARNAWRAVAVLLCAALAACGPRADEAAMLLADVAAIDAPSRLKAETPAPRRSAVAWHGGAGDLYLSPDGAEAALVLVPGLARTGKDDPRLVAFATSLARVRFAVLVPDIASLRALEVHADDVRAIATAAAWLAGDSALAPRGTVGVVAISYAAGPALLATLAPEAGGRIGFLVSVGGYHDIRKVVAFFTTGAFTVAGRARRLAPNAYGKWVFVKSNADRLADADDRSRLAAIAESRLDDPAGDAAGLAAGLGHEGRAVLALAENRDPVRVPALIAALPEAIRAEMAALDPARAPLERGAARLLLIHGRDDAIIPYSESLDLAARLGPERASLYLVDGLWHVDPDFSLADRLTLWRAALELLEFRDGID